PGHRRLHRRRHGRGLRVGVPRPQDVGCRRAVARRRHRTRQHLRHGPYRSDLHHRPRRRPPLRARGRRRGRDRQRVDPFHRRRGVRLRRRDRDQHTEAARPRAHGPARAHHDEVRHPRGRTDPHVTVTNAEPRFESVPAVREGLASVRYLADEGIAGVVYLADRLQKPVLIEGPAGTGKTELAKSIAELTGSRLIRLQCYEGLDESKALYEWNYKKQLLRIQVERNEDEKATWSDIEEDIFAEDFLLTRPLLEAIRAEDPVVLLIDEVDRVEVETEALLLEILSDYQVSIPELGTVTATQVPLVFLTSNNTRELSEALKRRCLYLHLDYPDLARE